MGEGLYEDPQHILIVRIFFLKKISRGTDEISNLQWVYNSDKLNVNWIKGDLTHDEFKSAIFLISKHLNEVQDGM